MFNSEKLKKRLQEILGKDTQEVIADKLHMSQGNVSKILSGAQKPTIDTLYAIAQAYNVSIDWLMGLSDRKKISKYNVEVSYEQAVKVIDALLYYGGTIEYQDKKMINICIRDPLLILLLDKLRSLNILDCEFKQEWINKKLSLFADKELIRSEYFIGSSIDFNLWFSDEFKNILEIHQLARINRDDFSIYMKYLEEQQNIKE